MADRKNSGSNDSISSNLKLEDNSKIAVIGGGPAGSFFSYFVLDMAGRLGLNLQVDIYEPKEFSRDGPAGCNMCGGIISESLVQILAAEGINLPSTVVQRGIDSYIMHTDAGSVRIDTPLHESRIAAVHRGQGPKGSINPQWESFDAYLLDKAIRQGAHHIKEKVEEVDWIDERPGVRTKEADFRSYDLLTVAAGVNTPLLKKFEKLSIDFTPPEITRTAICEYHFGEEVVSKHLGSSMHVFLLNIPRMKFAAIIPKKDYVTVCLLGEKIDSDLLDAFLNSAEVKNCMPEGWDPNSTACRCAPKMNIGPAKNPYSDRIVFIGDSGASRLYKDGIGAAYRTSKAAATTVIFNGISKENFADNYIPECKSIQFDNNLGKIIFAMTELVQKMQFSKRAILRMVSSEKAKSARRRNMSNILWDTFTGSAPYKSIFLRALKPTFLIGLLGSLAASIIPRLHIFVKGGESSSSDNLGKIYQDGEIIIHEGDTGVHMYVIQSGEVEVVRFIDGKDVRLAILYESDFFGEMALFEKVTRSTTIRALGETRVLTVDKNTFLKRVQSDPSMAFRIVQKMSGRIREVNTQLSRIKAVDRRNWDKRSRSQTAVR